MERLYHSLKNEILMYNRHLVYHPNQNLDTARMDY